MSTQCPHCLSPLEGVDPSAADVVCPSCGSSIKLDGKATTAWLPSQTARRLGKFEFLEELGAGAFRTVYRARDTALDRIVALKIPRTGSVPQPEDIERFLRKARSAARLQHPNIVALYDAGQVDNTCYLACEYVQGVTLTERLSAGQLDFRHAAELVAVVAEAVQFAHEHGVIHRDLKPANIMLDAEGRPHVMDFGLAKRQDDDSNRTLDGQVLGTPAYMSPEQARAEVHKVDAKSDVYSLGVILYELLAGELPFRGQKRMLLLQVMQDEPRPPRRLNDKIPHDLETICLKAMAKSPGQRYAAARGLADDLRRFLRGEPIQARPVTRFERLRRWCGRNPATTASSSCGTRCMARPGRLVRLWQLADKSIAVLDAGAAVEELAYSRDGKRLAVVTRRDLQLWDAVARREAARSPQVGICCAAFSPDGKLLATGEADRKVRLWDAETAKPLAELNGHTAYATGVAFSPHGKLLASCGHDGAIIFWDPAGQRELGRLAGHRAPIRAVAFAPDGKLLASGGLDGVIRFWDRTSRQPVGALRSSSGYAGSLSFARDGTLASVAQDGSIKRWRALLDSERTGFARHDGWVNAAVFAPSGKRLATTDTHTGALTLRDVATGKGETGPPGPSWMWHAAFSADETLLATGSSGAVQLWDLRRADTAAEVVPGRQGTRQSDVRQRCLPPGHSHRR